jgi:integrase
VRRLACEAADSGLLSPELAAGIRRVKGAKKLGVRLGNWLTAEEARSLWQLPSIETLKGKRDRAILAVLLGCGLRRRELAGLTFNDLQRREDHWALVDLVGKAGHVRTVPVPDWVKQTIDEWLTASGITSGKLFRCVCRSGTAWGDGMTKKLVWHIVKEYAAKIGLPKIAPHDLRRSCARLCHVAGGELEQIQFLLGHVSVRCFPLLMSYHCSTAQPVGSQTRSLATTARDARAIRAHSIPKRTAFLCRVRVASDELRDNSSFPESY